ncbi:MAG: DUF4381 domain-containing protein [Pseudomonadota bacterium]
MAEDLSKLGLVELIELLEPAPAPEPVSMLPQTVGWLWLMLVMLAFCTLGWRAWQRRRAAEAYRAAALRALDGAGTDPVQIAEIVRRTALSAFPRAEVAGLHGTDWLVFLDRTGGGDSFCNGAGRAIATAPYRPDTDPEGLAEAARGWVRGHRRDMA